MLLSLTVNLIKSSTNFHLFTIKLTTQKNKILDYFKYVFRLKVGHNNANNDNMRVYKIFYKNATIW